MGDDLLHDENVCVNTTRTIIELRYELNGEAEDAAEDEGAAEGRLAAGLVKKGKDEDVARDLDGRHEDEVNVLVAGELGRVQRQAVVHEGVGQPAERADQQPH